MLVIMKKQAFDSMGDDELRLACIEPIMLKVRGQKPEIKSQIYAQLPKGQQALFMFQVLYGHAHDSAAEFYWWISHLLEQPKTWTAIKDSLRYFDHNSMLGLLEETRIFLKRRNRQKDGTLHKISPTDLAHDPDLRASINRLYTTFYEIAPLTIKQMGKHIRNHPGEFLKLIDV
jgi:hypothetical protein